MNENNLHTGVAQIYLFVFTNDELMLQHYIEHIRNINSERLLYPFSLEGGGEGGLPPPPPFEAGDGVANWSLLQFLFLFFFIKNII